VSTLFCDPAAGDKVYAGTAIGQSFAGRGIYRSSDGGSTWEPLGSWLGGAARVHRITTDPNDSSILYAGGYGGLYKISGESTGWHPVMELDSTWPVTGVALDPVNDTEIVAGLGYRHGIWKTTDGGSHWSTVFDMDINNLLASPGNAEILYAVGHGPSFAKSTDGGDSWTTSADAPDHTVYDLAIDPIQNDMLYLATHDGVYQSTDGGSTFSPVGLQGSRVNSIALAPDGWRLYATTHSGELFLGQPALVVDSVTDELDGDHSAGDLSLREALSLATSHPGDDIIQFHTSLAGSTIVLDPALGELAIDSNVDILGLGADLLTVDAADRSRVLTVASGVAASICDLKITGGHTLETGGAIFNYGKLALTDAVFCDNWAAFGGGAIYNVGEMAIHAVVVCDNSSHSRGPGGGVCNEGTVTITATTIDSNVGTRGAGIYNCTTGHIAIGDSTISGNESYEGGGIFNEGTLAIANATVSGNFAWDTGGGVSNKGGSVKITNATISGNRLGRTHNGGGVFSDGGCITLHNTIVAGNEGVDDAGKDVFGVFEAASSYNLIGVIDGSTNLDFNPETLYGTDDSPIDPMLMPLGDYGGPTRTQALFPGSVAFDAGSNQRATEAGLTVDQRGQVRFSDADADGIATIDIGSYEHQGTLYGQIHGWVWYDSNGNGLRDEGEWGLDELTVALYRDDGDGILEAGADDVELSTQVTASSGAYEFSGLLKGDYWVDVDTSSPKLNGLVLVSGEDPRLVHLTVGLEFQASLYYSVNPSVTNLSVTTEIDENDEVTLTGSFEDPSVLGDRVLVDWGDGSSEVLVRHWRFVVGQNPRGVAFSPDGSVAYVANHGDSTVAVIDTTNHALLTTVAVDGTPWSVAFTPDGSHAYVSGGNVVSVMETVTHSVTHVIPVDSGWAAAVAVSPDGAKAYVTEGSRRDEAWVHVIDTETKTVTGRIDIPGLGWPDPGRAWAVEFTPDGNQAYVSCYYSGEVAVIDTSQDEVVDYITVRDGPAAISFTPDGALAYVANWADRYVSVIDVDQGTTMLGRGIPIPEIFVYGLDVSPDGKELMAANGAQDNLLVIDTESQSVVHSISLGDGPHAVAFSPDGAVAYVTNSEDGTVSVIGRSVNWVSAGEWSFSGTHVYLDDNPSNTSSDEYTIHVTIADEDTAFATASASVTVNNVAPTLGDVTLAIPENSPADTVVGTVAGVDPGRLDTLSYSIIGGNGAAAFVVDPSTGQIRVSPQAALDFETTPSLTLEVQVTDDDLGVGTGTVMIDLLNQASISGAVFVDVNENGLYEANEPGINGVTMELLDTTGNRLTATTTSDGGFYLFDDLDPGEYRIHQVQPAGVDDGAEIVGSEGGTILPDDTMQLTLNRIDATDYLFAELGRELSSGDTATIGFWQNKHGQQLIGEGGSELAAWLTSKFGNVFGDTFSDGVGDDSAEVAAFFKDQLFRQKSKKSAGPAKVDAQFMAVALATYFTSSDLAGDVAASYGFNVTDTGIGTKIVNLGANASAFGQPDNTDLTIMQLLLATNQFTDVQDDILGFAHIYDANGDGVIDAAEAALRAMANDVYSAINEQGNP
jgi:YVTN family beta-propeller protein